MVTTVTPPRRTPFGVSVLWVFWNLPERLYGGVATTTGILARFRPFAYPTMMVACYLVWQLRLQP
ncbi:hypothetical protein Hanom_Chr15g01345031 [Helianthus anomalus]